jgi:hypothetical protein
VSGEERRDGTRSDTKYSTDRRGTDGVFSRRRVLAVAGVAATAGCSALQGVAEESALTAEPAAVPDAAADAAGYEFVNARPVTVTRTVEAGEASREVEVTNQVTRYEKTLDLGVLGEARLGVVAGIASPAVEVGGRTLNPIGDDSNRQLVEMIAGRYSGLEVTGRENRRRIEFLGAQERETTFAGTATFEPADGSSVDVNILFEVVKGRSEADFVIGFGAYPRSLPGESDDVLAMLSAFEHPADV